MQARYCASSAETWFSGHYIIYIHLDFPKASVSYRQKIFQIRKRTEKKKISNPSSTRSRLLLQMNRALIWNSVPLERLSHLRRWQDSPPTPHHADIIVIWSQMAVPQLNSICITERPLAIWTWLGRDSAPGPSLFKLSQYWRLGDMFYNTTNVFHLEHTDSDVSFGHYSTERYPLPYMTGLQAHFLGITQSTLIWLELKRSEPFLPCQLRETLTTINKTDYNI